MGRILLLRHGETVWNRERRWQGWIDTPLAPEGEAQAAARGEMLAARGDCSGAPVYCSDLGRARRTAEIVATRLGSTATPRTEFRERNGGEWQGRTAEEIDEGWPGWRDAWRHRRLVAPPGGESDEEVAHRVVTALAEVVAEAGGRLVVVVTHGGVLRVVTDHAGGEFHAAPNLGGRWFTLEDGILRAGEELEPLPDAREAGAAVE